MVDFNDQYIISYLVYRYQFLKHDKTSETASHEVMKYM